MSRNQIKNTNNEANVDKIKILIDIFMNLNQINKPPMDMNEQRLIINGIQELSRTWDSCQAIKIDSIKSTLIL